MPLDGAGRLRDGRYAAHAVEKRENVRQQLSLELGLCTDVTDVFADRDPEDGRQQLGMGEYGISHDNGERGHQAAARAKCRREEWHVQGRVFPFSLLTG